MQTKARELTPPNESPHVHRFTSYVADLAHNWSYRPGANVTRK